MKKLLLSLITLLTILSTESKIYAINISARTFVLGTTGTIDASTYAGRNGNSFFICNGVTITLSFGVGNDTFYVSSGAKLIGTEANYISYLVLDSGATYDGKNTTNILAQNIVYVSSSSILNYNDKADLNPPYPGIDFNFSRMSSTPCSTTTSIQQLVQPTVSMDVFPNPCTGSFSINLKGVLDNGEVSIYNMLGEQVFNGSFTDKTNMGIDAGHWSNGVYFILLKGQNQELRQKLILNK